MKLLAPVLILFCSLLEATSCYTNCESRFPRWYQGPDRKRCQAEKALACLKSSRLPKKVDLSRYDARFESLQSRLNDRFLQRGYVVSRRKNGSALHQGDSLLWTSLAMVAAPCSDKTQVKAITNSIHKRGGALVRIEPLPKNYARNATSRDQVTGAMFGFALRAKKCPADRKILARAWKKHRKYVKKHDKLYKGSHGNYRLTPGFEFVHDLVSHSLGLGKRPGKFDLRVFEGAVLTGSKWITKRKESCYPLHLSTLNMITAARLGMAVNELTRREFCSDTRKKKLYLTDWFCGRGDWKNFLKSFRTDHYEYKHQRCKWERPDVDPGERSPAIDFLILKSLAGR